MILYQSTKIQLSNVDLEKNFESLIKVKSGKTKRDFANFTFDLLLQTYSVQENVLQIHKYFSRGRCRT